MNLTSKPSQHQTCSPSFRLRTPSHLSDPGGIRPIICDLSKPSYDARTKDLRTWIVGGVWKRDFSDLCSQHPSRLALGRTFAVSPTTGLGFPRAQEKDTQLGQV